MAAKKEAPMIPYRNKIGPIKHFASYPETPHDKDFVAHLASRIPLVPGAAIDAIPENIFFQLAPASGPLANEDGMLHLYIRHEGQ
jgi:hypothetical protein